MSTSLTPLVKIRLGARVIEHLNSSEGGCYSGGPEAAVVKRMMERGGPTHRLFVALDALKVTRKDGSAVITLDRAAAASLGLRAEVMEMGAADNAWNGGDGLADLNASRAVVRALRSAGINW